MTKFIEDLWICLSTGIVLFERLIDSKVDPNLFGAVLSALNTFAHELSEGGLYRFGLGQKFYTILQKRDLLFIASSSGESKEEDVRQELDTIAIKFLEQFPEDLFVDWGGKINMFLVFEKELEE